MIFFFRKSPKNLKTLILQTTLLKKFQTFFDQSKVSINIYQTINHDVMLLND